MGSRELKVPVQTLKRIFDYDPATGVLFRKQNTPGPRLRNGRRKTTCVWIDGTRVQGAEVAWSLVYGEPVPKKIYYVDGNPLNLKLDNLTYENPRNEKEKTI